MTNERKEITLDKVVRQRLDEVLAEVDFKINYNDLIYWLVDDYIWDPGVDTLTEKLREDFHLDNLKNRENHTPMDYEVRAREKELMESICSKYFNKNADADARIIQFLTSEDVIRFIKRTPHLSFGRDLNMELDNLFDTGLAIEICEEDIPMEFFDNIFPRLSPYIPDVCSIMDYNNYGVVGFVQLLYLEYLKNHFENSKEHIENALTDAKILFNILSK